MTATRIIFGDELALTIRSALSDVQESVYEALKHGGWMVIHGDDGQRVSVNPGRVLYMEEITLPGGDQAKANGDGPEPAHRPHPHSESRVAAH